MTKVLIVYEEIPEATHLYLLDVEDKDLKWMTKCHRRYINYEMPKACEKACDQLSEYLQDKPKVPEGKTPIDITGYQMLILTGFGM